jgi:hypothetical protein
MTDQTTQENDNLGKATAALLVLIALSMLIYAYATGGWSEVVNMIYTSLNAYSHSG